MRNGLLKFVGLLAVVFLKAACAEDTKQDTMSTTSNSAVPMPDTSAVTANDLRASASVSLDRGRWAGFVFQKQAGVTYTISVQTTRGDIDLYTHYNRSFQPSNETKTSTLSGTATDAVSFTAQSDGPYYVYLYGYASSSGRVSVISEGGGNSPSGGGSSDPRSFVRPNRDLGYSGPFDRTWYGDNTEHIGWDYPGFVGQSPVAIADGIVETVGSASGFGGCSSEPGGYIVIEHRKADGTAFRALYGHLSTSLQPGQEVRAGEAVGALTDYTPCRNPSTGAIENWPHLHFGIWDADSEPTLPLGYARNSGARNFVNPEEFLSANRYQPFPW